VFEQREELRVNKKIKIKRRRGFDREKVQTLEECLESPTIENMSPLLVAAKHDNFEIFSLLLERKVNIHV
jgi:hypothetical protein